MENILILSCNVFTYAVTVQVATTADYKASIPTKGQSTYKKS